MGNLLIDIGNSDVKIGYSGTNHTVKLLKRFSYSKDNFEKDFTNNFEKLKFTRSIDKTGISVLNDLNQVFLKKYFNRISGTVFINRKLKLPVMIDYTGGLGNDRICNAAAAAVVYNKKNMLVVDFGTATTYTLIINNVLTGGIISPGIKTSLISLLKNTSLPQVDLKFPERLFNKNTTDNIKAGVLYPAVYSTEKIISETKKKYSGLFVIATGGFAELISKKTKTFNEVDVDLVLKGINIIIITSQ